MSNNGVIEMIKRALCLALVMSAVSAMPASAEVAGMYGMWNDMPRSKPASTIFAPKPKPSITGAAPQLAPAVKSKKAGKSVALASGGPKVAVSAKQPTVVNFDKGYKAGSVVIDTSGRKLYYVLGNDKAYAYPVAVGKKGFTWSGKEKVSKVVNWPDWTPPEEMRARKPGLPIKMTGGVNNPLGAKAIYLGNTLYRIHGTNDPGSIGTAASSGCIRMHNGHVVHLAGMVSSNTTVHVVRSVKGS